MLCARLNVVYRLQFVVNVAVLPQNFLKYRSTCGAPEGENRNSCVIGGGIVGGGDGITFMCFA